MGRLLFLLGICAFGLGPISSTAQDLTANDSGDPYLWLEEIDGREAMAWVEERNAATLETLKAHPKFDSLYAQVLRILNSNERIAYPAIRGEYLYNFWQDEEHVRGIWRRTSWASYLDGRPEWDVLLDIDSLAAAEDTNWVFKGSNCLPPAYEQCLIRLSHGGADAAEVREFDVATRSFVMGGFALPEAKSSTAWVDENTLLISTDFGEGSLTTSGYPGTVRRWMRGTDLAAAETVFEGRREDVGAWARSFRVGDEIRPLIAHRPSFFEGTHYAFRDGRLVAFDMPKDADPQFAGDQIVIYLRSEWTTGGFTYPVGSLIAASYNDFLHGDPHFQTIVAPTARQTIEDVSTTRDFVLVTLLDNVVGELHRYRLEDGKWVGERIETPSPGSVNVVTASDDDNRFFFTYSSYVQPTTLYAVTNDGEADIVRQLPDLFVAEGLVVNQYMGTSSDGTKIPYFVVHEEGLTPNGTHPTLLYGYGGFQVSLTPGYSPIQGKAWLENGGVYVVANIRGGGEFGPAWHRSAQKEHRQRAYDDFIAVAEDLVARGITSPRHLGIHGGSNGGLLVGAVLMQRPDLFGAAVVAVPLLDMKRYNKLLAGASWMAEYGNPDIPDEWAYISRYSPYQHVQDDVRYPRPLFVTTTRDDRVHPGHARKMAAKMEGMGHPIMYFENTEGGHGSGVTHEQQAKMTAVIYTYLLSQLN